MTRRKVFAIGLDGFDAALAERYLAEGHMPALAALQRRSVQFRLDEGAARYAGLPWEHVSSGLTPEAGGRWGPIEFDPSSYTAWQDGAHFAPWWRNTDIQAVVFDTPFVDLRRARNTQGIVAWGSHSPGTVMGARPSELAGEFAERFGAYPAEEWVYRTPWHSPALAEQMGKRLSDACAARSSGVRWLATERLPHWDFFFVVAGELHSAVEGLWHGVDSNHPLHNCPSAEPAAAAMLSIHQAFDRMLGELVEAAGDAVIIAFNPGGMGPNTCDVQSMVLLPELLYRYAFGQSRLTLPAEWTTDPRRFPMLNDGDDWGILQNSWVPEPQALVKTAANGNGLRHLARRLPSPLRGALKRTRSAMERWKSRRVPPDRLELDYMPSYRYSRDWSRMPAFALPSFLEGRVRINLRGRERHGLVEPSQYEVTCRRLEAMLLECRDPRTGEPAVATIERSATTNPLRLGTSDSDLLVVWSGVATAIEHPQLGVVGPVPFRRTGGHTREGVIYITHPDLQPGKRCDARASADVAPTIAELLGVKPVVPIVGTSLLAPRP